MTAERPTIVLITTQPVVRDMYERHGERFAKIVCVPDVQECIRKAAHLRPRAVLLDADTVQNSIQAVRDLRAQALLRQSRLAVFTRHLDHDHVAAFHEAGADDILVTTYDTPRDIVARLQAQL